MSSLSAHRNLHLSLYSYDRSLDGDLLSFRCILHKIRMNLYNVYTLSIPVIVKYFVTHTVTGYNNSIITKISFIIKLNYFCCYIIKILLGYNDLKFLKIIKVLKMNC